MVQTAHQKQQNKATPWLHHTDLKESRVFTDVVVGAARWGLEVLPTGSWKSESADQGSNLVSFLTEIIYPSLSSPNCNGGGRIMVCAFERVS